MRRLIDLVKLARLDNLIRRQATGNPEELAERLELSRSSLFEIIAFLKEEMGAPIRYNRYRPSYVYEYTPKFNLGFEKDRLPSSDMYDITGGSDKAGQDDVDMDDNKWDDDIDFNDLYNDDFTDF